MTEGFYGFYYTGFAGSGFGLLVLMDGLIAGVDASGGIYDGEYKINRETSGLNGNLQFRLPAGIPLVTGVVSENEPLLLNIPLQLPINFSDGQTITIETSTGPVNVIFKKLRNLLK